MSHPEIIPVDCPLLLVNLREVNSDLDSVIQEAGEWDNIQHALLNNDIKTFGEASAASLLKSVKDVVDRQRGEWFRHGCRTRNWGSNCCKIV